MDFAFGVEWGHVFEWGQVECHVILRWSGLVVWDLFRFHLIVLYKR